MLRYVVLAIVWLVLVSMGGCSTGARKDVMAASALSTPLQDWSLRDLPGKPATRYTLNERAGRPCVLAQAEASASLLRRQLRLSPEQLGTVEFNWWIERFEAGRARVIDGADDAAARLVLAFEGDESTMSMRNRMMFELARTMTGEAPPYATLMYVWDMKAESGTVIVNSHTDRIRKIVVGSGRPGKLGWQRFRRDVAADFRLAFGEEPGPLVGMALMTDADNIRGTALACYGDVLLLDASADASTLAGSLRF